MIVPLSYLFIYLSHFELLDLFISSINYHTFSSTSLSLSPFELPDLFISQINCTRNFLFKSYVEIFFSLPVVPIYSFIVIWVSNVRSFLFWFLIGFARFHDFIYLFIWFFCSAQYFYFLVLVFFVPLVL